MGFVVLVGERSVRAECENGHLFDSSMKTDIPGLYFQDIYFFVSKLLMVYKTLRNAKSSAK